MAVRLAASDYGSGNVRSACCALEHVGAEVELISDRDTCLNADGLSVSGVGAFAAVMAQLREANGPNIIEHRLSGGCSTMDVCAGLQVMFESSEEKGEAEGLAQWSGAVRCLDAPVVPHMGWSPVEAGVGSMFSSGAENQCFYFVYSYAMINDPAAPSDDGCTVPPLVSWVRHGDSRFVVAVKNGPPCDTQFHPEKSDEAGPALPKNWPSSL